MKDTPFVFLMLAFVSYEIGFPWSETYADWKRRLFKTAEALPAAQVRKAERLLEAKRQQNE